MTPSMGDPMNTRWFGRERAQTIVIAALLLPILLGMTGMAIDIGTYATERRDLQNAADSIALAAAQSLPDADAAQAAAASYATKNGLSSGDYALTITGGSTTPNARVVITKTHDFHFMRVVGIESRAVGAVAAAGKFSMGGGAGVVPWSITQATLDASTPGALVTIKYDANGGNNGNFGAIRIDGSGSSDYEYAAKYGSTTSLCAATTPGCTAGACPGSYPSVCSETAPECDGPECQPKTGNMTGPTRNAVDFRTANTADGCDTFGEVFTPSTDVFTIDRDCNPWAGAGACPPAPSSGDCSRRVIIIPVIDDFGNGSSDPVEIQRFALLFLEGYDDGKCSGNSCEIKARFVNAELTTGAIAGAYEDDAPIKFAKLTE
jgi:hypothetical protein